MNSSRTIKQIDDSHEQNWGAMQKHNRNIKNLKELLADLEAGKTVWRKANEKWKKALFDELTLFKTNLGYNRSVINDRINEEEIIANKFREKARMDSEELKELCRRCHITSDMLREIRKSIEDEEYRILHK